MARFTALRGVRALQHALYRAAKADPGRNDGVPGIDKITLAGVGEYGVDRLLGELASELKKGRCRPLAARRVFIPKPGAPAGEQRFSMIRQYARLS